MYFPPKLTVKSRKFGSDRCRYRNSPHDWAFRSDLITEGLDARHVASLVKLGFFASEMRQIGELPMSVISGKGTPERLSAEQGNRVTRMARVATLAIAVFGDRDKAWAWLRAPKNRFGNQTCVDVLRTEYGGRSVETLLLRLRHGMAA